MITEKFSDKILCWFDQQGRKNLPWQQNMTSYRVWISEIMLQQTQVKTVVPYFQAFMARFPDVFSLAEGSIDEVLGLWSGLGYYARARNLHQAAQILVSQYHGKFPDTLAALCDLPGIGRSTAGAILSISQGRQAAILDGNVRRVLCRFQAIEGFPGEARVQKQLWALAEQYTPASRAGDYAQAMMDLGSMVCKRSSPDCSHCPLKERCVAYQQGNVQDYPWPKPKKNKPVKSCLMLLLTSGEKLLLYQRDSTGIWGGLWSLPEFQSTEALQCFCRQYDILWDVVKTGALHRHTFTHFHLDVTPVYIQLHEKPGIVMRHYPLAWYGFHQLDVLGLPALVKKLIKKREAYAQNDLLS